MSDRKFYKPALAGLLVMLFALAWFTESQLNVARETLGLTRVAPLANAPPVLTLTTQVLGGFRGLIANVLWIRANELQLSGKYFEMVQLADWITKLQPHMATVWAHQAWNMAYNISVKFPDPGDRWLWVDRGITLLRDEGLRYNPTEITLYHELARILHHKVGQNSDSAHMMYKYHWSVLIEKAVPGGRPNYDELLNPQTDDARNRVKILKDELKMDPAIMKEVDDSYGPLEWRLPETSAIYWAAAGMRKVKVEDKVVLRRVIYQSMQLAVQRGRMIENKFDKRMEFGPNIDMIPNANASYERMMKEEPRAKSHMEQGHRNFLIQAVTDLYVFNRLVPAQQWFQYLTNKYPDVLWGHPGAKLDDYVVYRLTDDVANQGRDKLKGYIEGLLSQHYYYLAVGEEDYAIGLERFAARIWKSHTDKISDPGMRDIVQRLALPPYALMKREMLAHLLDPRTGTMSPQLAAQLRTRLGLPGGATSPVAGDGGVPAKGAEAPTAAAAKAAEASSIYSKAEGEKFLGENQKRAGVVTLPSGLQYKVLKEGTGPIPKATDKVKVHYRGTLIDGREFDSSYKRGEAIVFEVRTVIKGWQEALQRMKVGSKWQLVLPPRLAYGERGYGNVIAPNTVLLFEMELLSLEK